MKISVITVVRNGADVLEETMRSVLEQDYPDVEYLVIDGASTDGTLAVAERRRDRLSVLLSEPDGGIYEAMNKGIRLATGEVIGLLNAGDRYLPGALRLVAESFRKEGTEGRIFWGDVEYSRHGRVRGFRPENLFRGAFAPHPSMFVPRSVYETVGLYDETFRLLGDYDFMYRAVNVCGVRPLYVPEVVAFYQEGGLSDRHIARCLCDELRVKLRYGAPKWQACGLFLLKILKNLPRMVLA